MKMKKMRSKEHSLPEEVMDDEEILAAKLEQERLEKGY